MTLGEQSTVMFSWLRDLPMEICGKGPSLNIVEVDTCDARWAMRPLEFFHDMTNKRPDNGMSIDRN